MSNSSVIFGTMKKGEQQSVSHENQITELIAACPSSIIQSTKYLILDKGVSKVKDL